MVPPQGVQVGSFLILFLFVLMLPGRSCASHPLFLRCSSFVPSPLLRRYSTVPLLSIVPLLFLCCSPFSPLFLRYSSAVPPPLFYRSSSLLCCSSAVPLLFLCCSPFPPLFLSLFLRYSSAVPPLFLRCSSAVPPSLLY